MALRKEEPFYELSAKAKQQFWLQWQELYDPRDPRCPVLRAIRFAPENLCPPHLSLEEFKERLLDHIERGIRKDFTRKIAEGIPPDEWISTIENVHAWLRKIVLYAAIDFRKSRAGIPGYRAKIKGEILHLEDIDLEPSEDPQLRKCEYFLQVCPIGLKPPLDAWLIDHVRGCDICVDIANQLTRRIDDFCQDVYRRECISPNLIRLFEGLKILESAIAYLEHSLRFSNMLLSAYGFAGIDPGANRARMMIEIQNSSAYRCLFEPDRDTEIVLMRRHYIARNLRCLWNYRSRCGSRLRRLPPADLNHWLFFSSFWNSLTSSHNHNWVLDSGLIRRTKLPSMELDECVGDSVGSVHTNRRTLQQLHASQYKS